MKKILLLLALIVPLASDAMKIAHDEIDEFFATRTLYTSWEGVDKNNIRVRFRYQANKYFMDFQLMSNNSYVISTKDRLLVKDDKGGITSFTPTDVTSSSYVNCGPLAGVRWKIDNTYQGDIEWFLTHCARLMRIYTTDCYVQSKLSEADGNKLMKLASLFYSALDEECAAHSSRLISCTLTFMKRKSNKNEWEIISEEYLEDEFYDVVEKKMKEWRDKSDDNYTYDVKLKKEH